MKWIEIALNTTDFEYKIDDMFSFFRSEHVISRCAEGEPTDICDANVRIFIKSCHCEHELEDVGELEEGGECLFAEWIEILKSWYEDREEWESELDEEVFFRAPEDIPGGEELLRRHGWKFPGDEVDGDGDVSMESPNEDVTMDEE